jgi:hypothetical protein
MIHLGGVAPGGTLALVQEDTYICDENGNNCTLIESTTDVSESVAGAAPITVSQSANYRLEEQSTGFTTVAGLELTSEPVEYRADSAEVHENTLPGLTKYGGIHLRRPAGFNWQSFKLEFPDFQSPTDSP